MQRRQNSAKVGMWEVSSQTQAFKVYSLKRRLLWKIEEHGTYPADRVTRVGSEGSSVAPTLSQAFCFLVSCQDEENPRATRNSQAVMSAVRLALAWQADLPRGTFVRNLGTVLGKVPPIDSNIVNTP